MREVAGAIETAVAGGRSGGRRGGDAGVIDTESIGTIGIEETACRGGGIADAADAGKIGDVCAGLIGGAGSSSAIGTGIEIADGGERGGGSRGRDAEGRTLIGG